MPVYHRFMDESCKVADVVELIHPARFLFETGRTPDEFNKRKLNDPHFKILQYEADASTIFPNTDIKGGVVVSLHNKKKEYGAIEIFIPEPNLETIFEKVWRNPVVPTSSIFTLISPRLMFHYSDSFFSDHPKLDASSGPLHSVQSDAFDKNNDVFTGFDDDSKLKFLGKKKGFSGRVWRFIDAKYIEPNEFIHKWKIIIPRSIGNGLFGEDLAQPVIGAPRECGTDTFICIGPFDTKEEVSAAYKYISSKFARSMLGVLKKTQGNTRPVWRYVPIQDFTPNSDIDWSVSVQQIDQQLYRKYGLSGEEIAFIETHVKEMA